MNQVVACQQRLVQRTSRITRVPAAFKTLRTIHTATLLPLLAARQTQHAVDKRSFRRHASGSSNDPSEPATTPAPEAAPTSTAQQSTNLVTSLGLGAIYLCLLGYAFLVVPDQTPARDMYFLKKVLNLVEDGYQLPAVWWSLFNIMGVYPALYGRILIPTAASANKVPAWPFVSLSFFTGAFALIPYFILWQPQQNAPKPTEPSDVSKIGWTAVEVGLLLAALGLWGNALLAGPAAWSEYFHLFDESKLTHVTTIDFLTLTVLMPFWMYNDAQARSWEKRDQLVPVLCALPVVGPAIYLLLRPKNY